MFQVRRIVILIHLSDKKLSWILTKPIDLKPETVPLIVYIWFVLHDFCRTKSTFLLDEDKVKVHMEQSFHIITSLDFPNSTNQSIHLILHKNRCFPLGISSVNVTKSAGKCGFGHIY